MGREYFNILVFIKLTTDYEHACKDFVIVNKAILVAESYTMGTGSNIRILVSWVEKLNWFPVKETQGHRGSNVLMYKSNFEKDAERILQWCNNNVEAAYNALVSFNEYNKMLYGQNSKTPQHCTVHGCYLYVCSKGTDYNTWLYIFRDWYLKSYNNQNNDILIL